MTPIAGGYSYTALRVGLVLRSPSGRAVYFQPGDATATILETIEALEEVPDNRRAIITDMVLGDYF